MKIISVMMKGEGMMIEETDPGQTLETKAGTLVPETGDKTHLEMAGTTDKAIKDTDTETTPEDGDIPDLQKRRIGPTATNLTGQQSL